MKSRRRRIAGLVALVAAGALAGPAAAEAASCTLSGSGQEGPVDTSLYQAPDSTLEASMLFVDFPDHQAVGAPTEGPVLTSWAQDYFEQVSGGRMSMDVQMDTAWRRMSKPASQYSFQTFADQRAFLAEAVALADPSFNFAGRQTIYVVAAPTGGALPNSPAFIAFNNEAIVADGTRIRWGSSLGDDAHNATDNYGSHVLAHETGHTFGLPDLYTYGASFANAHLNAGAWDLMGWIGPGLGFNAWHRQKLGWLDAAQATCVDGEATATISPLSATGGTKMMIAKTSASTAYVAEVRNPFGVDAGMCDPGGVVIYEVDANAATGGSANAGPIEVELSDPSNPGDPNSAQCGALSNAPFGVGQTFTAGAVSVQVLGGSPAAGFQVRMTGPATPVTPDPDPDPTPDPVPTSRTGGIERKLRMDGRKRVDATLTCPAAASACTGTLKLKLAGFGKLADADYSVAPPGGDVPLSLDREARKALSKKFARRSAVKLKATLTGDDGVVKVRVKLIR